MREIKFRTWNGSYMEYNPELTGHYDVVDLNEALNDTTDIFMQYTGLKDKNGKDIYEGDILQLGKGNDGAIYACVVTFNHETGAFACRKIEEDKPYSDHMYGSHIVEVIGNIYQDGHLLDK